MKPYLLIDIETEPLPVAKLNECMPEFEAPGNLKDPEKIKAAIEGKRGDWLAESALHAERCRILCAGIWYSGIDEPEMLEGSERSILDALWRHIELAWTNHTIVGHYIFGFDLPLMVRRSWSYGGLIKPFLPIVYALRQYYPPEGIFDTALAWKLSNREEKISLKTLAWHLGAGAKDGDGKDFAPLYRRDKAKALEYLKNDLWLVGNCYKAICPDP